MALAALDFRFIGGSMGSVVGERVARTIELAGTEELPLVIVSASGGARMFEGVYSLMQLAKTSVALSLRRGFLALRLDLDRSHLRRGYGLVRDGGRRGPGRARGQDRVHRSAGHRADDQAAARGFPDGGVPEGARDGRPYRAPPQPEGRPRTATGVPAVILDFERPIKDFEERIAELRRSPARASCGGRSHASKRPSTRPVGASTPTSPLTSACRWPATPSVPTSGPTATPWPTISTSSPATGSSATTLPYGGTGQDRGSQRRPLGPRQRNGRQ